MATDSFDIGIVTDEVSRVLSDALEWCETWGISRFELREGETQRFPDFTRDEINSIEALLQRGGIITAVSPGILKGHVEDEARLRDEIEKTLPRSLDLAARFACPTLIVFGFERYAGEPDRNRIKVLRAFERVAEAAIEANMTVAIENEPNFWIDQPEETAALLEEIGHPALKVNWDPANLQWGGIQPTYEHFLHLQPHLANLHVKDYNPGNPERLWPPVGQGQVVWPDILSWAIKESNLPHATLETHSEPPVESSRESLAFLRDTVAEIQAG